MREGLRVSSRRLLLIPQSFLARFPDTNKWTQQREHIHCSLHVLGTQNPHAVYVANGAELS